MNLNGAQLSTYGLRVYEVSEYKFRNASCQSTVKRRQSVK